MLKKCLFARCLGPTNGVMAGGKWAPEKNIYLSLPPDTFLDPPRGLVKRLKNDTLLVVTGDHGMTISGNLEERVSWKPQLHFFYIVPELSSPALLQR